MNAALTNARSGTRWAAAVRKARLPSDDWLPVSTPAGSAVRMRPVWWLWPHLLSLDAPLVALVWQRWWAQRAGVTMPVSREVILGLGVWFIYLTDRLADTTGGERVCSATRHAFSAHQRHFLLPLAVAVALTLVAIAPSCLPLPEFLAGVGLLALMVGHFWLTHGWPGGRWAAYVPKEAVVGAMFSAGSAFFVAYRSHHFAGAPWLGIILFAGVCFLNCALITLWERHAEDLSERSSLLNAFPRLSARLGLLCLLLAGLALAARSISVVPIAVSALLLAALDHHRNSLSTDALRVLADLVLLTPCLLLWR